MLLKINAFNTITINIYMVLQASWASLYSLTQTSPHPNKQKKGKNTQKDLYDMILQITYKHAYITQSSMNTTTLGLIFTLKSLLKETYIQIQYYLKHHVYTKFQMFLAEFSN